MVKNWADHCSSDEEEEDVGRQHHRRHAEEMDSEDAPAASESQPVETHEEDENASYQRDGEQPPRDEQPHQQQGPPKPRVYEFPSEPPFTAYVGNLAYSIQEADDLANAVTDIVKEYLNADIRVVHARVMKDKMNNYKPRGFGYVEVETLDMLQTIIQLNEVPDAMLAGRKIQVDTATGGGGGGSNQRRGGSFRNSNNNNRRDSASHPNRGIPDIDGSKFRGGRYAHKNQRNYASEDGGNNNSNDKDDGGAAAAEPPPQRPSLKLKPRSKPLLETGTLEESKNESIFGGAKPRDEQVWQERRNSERRPSEKEENRRKSNTNNDRRGSRSSGRGSSGHTQPHHDSIRKNNHKTDNNKKKEESSAHATPSNSTQPPTQQPAHKKEAMPANAKADAEKAAPKKVANTFAALAMDSDSD
jgi:translation initiation factor 4B